jgi:hypothetical protein
MNFLADRELRPVALAEADGLPVEGLLLGHGASAFEVLVPSAPSKPSIPILRSVWKAPVSGRVTTVLLVTLYGDKAAVVGPAGDHPSAYADVDPQKMERICAAALDEPDRHAALRFLKNVLLDLQSTTAGLRNEGLFASHELEEGVPTHSDWADAQQRSIPILNVRDGNLLKALGFTVDALPGPVQPRSKYG